MNWQSIVPFTYEDANQHAKPAEQTASENQGSSADSGGPPWGSSSDPYSSGGSESNGSPYGNGGAVMPPIVLLTDYWLRDQNNAIISDENSAGISLEGLTYA